jgi:hypothetical protein
MYRLAVGGGSPQRLFEARRAWNLSCSGRVANRCVSGASSDDGRTLTITEFDPIRGKGRDLLRIPTDPHEGYGWMLSPDGTQIGLAKNLGRPNQVQLFPLGSGKPRIIEVRWPYDTCTSVDWAPDANSLYIVPGNHRVDATICGLRAAAEWPIAAVSLRPNASPVVPIRL